MLLSAAEYAVIEDNVLAGNMTDGEGGGIIAINTDRMTIAQNLFYGNSAQWTGGGISLHPPDEWAGPFVGLIQNNTFIGNTAQGPVDEYEEPTGSQVYMDANLGVYEFTDNIVIGNDAAAALVCGTIYNYLSYTPLVIDHNDIYNPKGPAVGGACSDQTGQFGNISADPLFKNPAGNDYHLVSGSPAIDSGNNSALQLLANLGVPLSGDLDGKPRVQDATGKGYLVIDMGVFEFPGNHSQSPTTVVLNPSSYYPQAGQTFTLTANMYSSLGVPTGTVTFFEDGNDIGSAVIDDTGAAMLTLGKSLVPGLHTFLATYPGQGKFTPCESVKIYILIPIYGVNLTLTSSPNPSLVGQSVQFKINLSAADGVPTGQVTLTDASSGTTLATLTPDKSGNASSATSTLSVGVHLIEASYAGDATHASAAGSVYQTVVSANNTTTTITSSLNPSIAGQSVTFMATVSANSVNGTPDGTVSFLDGAKSLAIATLQNGVAAYSASTLNVGSHNITANYNGNANWAASSASLNQVVNGIQTSTAMTASPNPVYATHSVTLSAQVTGKNGGTPTGTVAFLDGGAQLATASLSASGKAAATITFSVASNSPHLLSAVYSGDSIFSASTSQAVQETVQINPTATVIASITPNPVAAFHSTALVAKITSSTSPNGNPGGTVTFATSTSVLGTASVQNGAATLTVNAGAVGAYAVTASYSGDPAFASSASPAKTLTVVPESSSVTLTSSANPAIVGTPVTFKAVATPQSAGDPMTGTTTFFDGSAQLGPPVTVNAGSASFQTSSLTLGKHSITAVYSGDSNVLTSTSAALEQSMVLYTGDFALSVTPSKAALYTGEAAKFTLEVTPKNGFNYPVNLSCGDLPQDVTCTFTPNSISGGQGHATLVVQTSVPQKTASSLKTSGATAVLAASFGIFLLPRRRRFVWLALIVVAFVGLSGCGSNPKIAGGTSPGVYTITVTAQTSSSGPQLQHSAHLTLTVKSLF